MLLGEHVKGVLDVTNSYAVPFEEDERDPNIWFLDHSFHETMFSMFKKARARTALWRACTHMHSCARGSVPASQVEVGAKDEGNEPRPSRHDA